MFTVFAARCSVFARMCSLSGQMCPVSGADVSALFPPISPRSCPLGPQISVSTRSLDRGSRDEPGLPGRSGSDFGGMRRLGNKASHRPRSGRAGQRRLRLMPFRDLCVTRGGLPSRSIPRPAQVFTSFLAQETSLPPDCVHFFTAEGVRSGPNGGQRHVFTQRPGLTGGFVGRSRGVSPAAEWRT